MSIDYDELARAGGIGKGEDHWLAGRKRRKAVADHEDDQKTLVRKRDGYRCRWPKCERCVQWHPPLEVAHVIAAKGMGPSTKAQSTADRMMLLCRLTHQLQEAHRLDVQPLTDEGTDGPCLFLAQDENRAWYVVAEETAIGIYRRD